MNDVRTRQAEAEARAWRAAILALLERLTVAVEAIAWPEAR